MNFDKSNCKYVDESIRTRKLHQLHSLKN